MPGTVPLAGPPCGNAASQAVQAVLWATMMPSHARFGNHFPHGLLVDLLYPLIGELGVAFTRLDGRMPQQFLDGDDLCPSFQQVRSKRMAQTVTARLDAGRLGIDLLYLSA